MLAWMGYAMLAAAALGVAAWLVDFSVAGRFGRRRVLNTEALTKQSAEG